MKKRKNSRFPRKVSVLNGRSRPGLYCCNQRTTVMPQSKISLDSDMIAGSTDYGNRYGMPLDPYVIFSSAAQSTMANRNNG
jgi:hypothetical protein